MHVLAVPRPEGGSGRVGWCAVRDEAVARICGGGPSGSKYRVLQDGFHARVSHRFGLGRGAVGSEALHEAVDRVKAVEARTRLAQREAAEATEVMVAAHAEHQAVLARLGASFEKKAELHRRTERAKEEAAEAEAERAVERARQAGQGTHAEGVAACFRAVRALLRACGVWPARFYQARALSRPLLRACGVWDRLAGAGRPSGPGRRRRRGARWPTWRARSRRSGRGGRRPRGWPADGRGRTGGRLKPACGSWPAAGAGASRAAGDARAPGA